MRLHMHVFKEERGAQSAGREPAALDAPGKGSVLYVGRFRFSGKGQMKEVSASTLGELATSLKGKLLETEPEARGKVISNCSFKFQPSAHGHVKPGNNGGREAKVSCKTLAMSEITDFLRAIEQTVIRQALI